MKMCKGHTALKGGRAAEMVLDFLLNVKVAFSFVN